MRHLDLFSGILNPIFLPAILGLLGIIIFIILDGICVWRKAWTFSKALNWWYCESATGWIMPCFFGVLIGHFWTRHGIPPMTGWKLAGLTVFIIAAVVDLARTYWTKGKTASRGFHWLVRKALPVAWIAPVAVGVLWGNRCW